MYVEFVIGYALMGVLAVLLAAVIVLQCVILKKLSDGARTGSAAYRARSGGTSYTDARGVVVCRNCATQFASTSAVCPRCGEPR